MLGGNGAVWVCFVFCCVEGDAFTELVYFTWIISQSDQTLVWNMFESESGVTGERRSHRGTIVAHQALVLKEGQDFDHSF